MLEADNYNLFLPINIASNAITVSTISNPGVFSIAVKADVGITTAVACTIGFNEPGLSFASPGKVKFLISSILV